MGLVAEDHAAHLHPLRDDVAYCKHLDGLPAQFRQPLLVPLNRVTPIVVLLAAPQGEAIVGGDEGLQRGGNKVKSHPLPS